MEHQGNEQSGGLSVNAAVFIPRGYIPSLGTAPVQSLPTYMTNCFPFVQPDFNGNRPSGSYGNWSRNTRPRFGNRNSSGNHGIRPPAPNKFSEPPLFPFSSPPPDPFFSHFIPPPNNVFMNSVTSLPVMPSGNDYNDGSDEHNANNNSFTSNNRQRRKDRHSKNDFRMMNDNIEEGRNFRRSNESLDENGRKFGRSKENINEGGRKFKRSNEKISEGGRRNENSQRQRRRTNSGRKGGNAKDTPRSKVLVLYEREVQTDFSDFFSHLSLMQHPSSLYKSSIHRRRGECTDVDADSGYSSPLHRKNQVSSSTQSDCVTPQFISSIQSDDPSIVHAAKVPQQKFTYAFIAQKEPSPQPVINIENQRNVIRENYKDKRQKTGDRNNSGNFRKNSNQNSKPTNSHTDNRSHDYKDSYNTNSPHINKNTSKQFCNTNEDEMQSKGNQRKKYSQKLLNNVNPNPRGENSKMGIGRNEEHDYGFSRTKNLHTDKQGDRRNFKQESNFGTKSLQEEKMQPNDKNSANEKGGDVNKTDDNCEPGKKKRRRRRRRKKKPKDGEDQESQEEEDPEMKQEIELHFEDVEEFPDLSSAKASDNLSTGLGISYSAILQTIPSPKPHITEPDKNNRTSSSEDSPRKDYSVQELKGTRASRRRKKRKDILNKEAENELAEISLEQQMLKEQCLKTTGQKTNKDEKGHTPGILKINPKSQPSGKKSKQNVSLDLGAVIDALEQKKSTISLTSVPRKEQKSKQELAKKKDTQKSKGSHNVLDANAPVKRGKERETPKAKKPSPLKKVILKEREEKKHLRMLEGPESVTGGAPVGIGVVSAESDLSQDAMSTKSSVDYTGTPGSANLSPVSQTSPISMSPLSPGTSPLSSEVNSPIAGAVGKDVIRKIHSRRFREYCNQVLDKDIDECATTLLQDLVRFQDRMYHKDPSKAKLKRRLVLGLREVTKHLKLKKIKCVIISPNLEKIQSKGGLDDALNNILNLCNEQNVPFVFALGRRALGRACAKLVPVSVVGIFNFSGSEENFRQLIDLTEKAREAYGEMVDAIEKEIKEYPIKIQQPSIPHVFAHMGHSRTPSGASVLSFTSSILSEPISENYPHSEPETDSKGYEIIKDDALIKQGLPTSPSGYQTQMRIIHSNRRAKLDDGNEADNEEEAIKINKNNLRTSEEDLSLDGSDMVSALPHIDSIHSSTHDLNTEILSQHSGRTLENCEAMSTHSSRTLGDGSSTILADMGDRSKHGTPKSTESPSNTLQRGKVVDEERIQHWVDETSSRLENLALEEESYEDSSDDMTDSENDSSDDKEGFGPLGRDFSDIKSSNNQLRNTNIRTGDHENSVMENSDLHKSERDLEKVNSSKNENENETDLGKHVCDNLDIQKLEKGGNCSSCGSERMTSSAYQPNLSVVSPAYLNDCDKFLTAKQEHVIDSSPHNLDSDHSGTMNKVVNSSDTMESLACDKNNDDEINKNDNNAAAPENVEIHID